MFLIQRGGGKCPMKPGNHQHVLKMVPIHAKRYALKDERKAH